jgi:hypothetical protein
MHHFNQSNAHNLVDRNKVFEYVQEFIIAFTQLCERYKESFSGLHNCVRETRNLLRAYTTVSKGQGIFFGLTQLCESNKQSPVAFTQLCEHDKRNMEYSVFLVFHNMLFINHQSSTT